MGPNHVPTQIAPFVDRVDVFLSKYPTLFQYEKLKELEDKTGYSKVYFFAAISSLLLLLVFAVGGVKFLTDLVSYIYPAYMSFKAIDSGDAPEHTQWLTYWVVFSFISILESVALFITEWIPFYFGIKLCFFIWMYHPKFQGAGLVYTQAIRPMIKPYVEPEGVVKKDS